MKTASMIALMISTLLLPGVAGLGTAAPAHEDGSYRPSTTDLQTGCCVYLTGNVDGDPNDVCDIGDLTALIGYLFNQGPEPSCPEEANIDGEGSIDIGDLTRLIQYLFIDFVEPSACPIDGQFGTIIDHMDSVNDSGNYLRVAPGSTITLYLRYVNQTSDTAVNGFQSSFRIYSSDGVNWGDVVVDSLIPGWTARFEAIHFIRYFDVDGISPDTIEMAGASFSSGLEHTMEPGFSQHAYSIRIGPFSAADDGKHFILDTCSMPVSGEPLFTLQGGGVGNPIWNGPFEFVIDAGIIPANSRPPSPLRQPDKTVE